MSRGTDSPIASAHELFADSSGGSSGRSSRWLFGEHHLIFPPRPLKEDSAARFALNLGRLWSAISIT